MQSELFKHADRFLLQTECSRDYPCQGMGRHAHFRDFGTAMLTLFRIATGDNWNGILKVLDVASTIRTSTSHISLPSAWI